MATAPHPIDTTIKTYLSREHEWAGYLLWDHDEGMCRIELLQRPGTQPPLPGRTLALVKDEGLPGEVAQFVRITRVEVKRRSFSRRASDGQVNYPVDVVVCHLTDALRTSFPGSPPSRGFVRTAGKTVVRDTQVHDAAAMEV